MVTICFGHFADPRDEFKSSNKILDRPVFANSLIFVSEVPAVQILKLLCHKGERAGIDAPFTGFALSGG
jgi:hypothetical protein